MFSPFMTWRTPSRRSAWRKRNGVIADSMRRAAAELAFNAAGVETFIVLDQSFGCGLVIEAVKKV
ncbi:hypothetical protein AL755_15515 [Arthrobacter sp. ERGS1:01]|nr:hypothetical protein AL755_15515 [Arthrobacter sp. ERGS1:01]